MHPLGLRVGIWAVRGTSWRFDADATPRAAAANVTPALWLSNGGHVIEPLRSNWAGKRLLLDGHHPGCIERRDRTIAGLDYLIGARGAASGSACEFDGRLSLARFRGEFLLYTRANPAAHGRRHVQVSRSADGVRWSPFELVRIDGYDGFGEIYFFAVQINPAHDGSLLAIFPLVDRLKGCIAAATSYDGVAWSAATPLVGCDIYGERTLDQPAAPAMVARGSQVWLYIHEDVPRITIDRAVPMRMYSHLVANEPSSTVVRYSFRCQRLGEWTRRALATLSLAATREPFRDTCGAAAPAPAADLVGSCSWDSRGPPFARKPLPPPPPPPRPKKRKPRPSGKPSANPSGRRRSQGQGAH